MKDSTLLKISLAVSLLGIAILFFCSIMMAKEEMGSLELLDDSSPKSIHIKGEVSKLTEKEGVTLISVSRKTYVDVVVFGNLSIKKGDNINIEGNVKDYNGKKEIIATKVYR